MDAILENRKRQPPVVRFARFYMCRCRTSPWHSRRISAWEVSYHQVVKQEVHGCSRHVVLFVGYIVLGTRLWCRIWLKIDPQNLVVKIHFLRNPRFYDFLVPLCVISWFPLFIKSKALLLAYQKRKKRWKQHISMQKTTRSHVTI